MVNPLTTWVLELKSLVTPPTGPLLVTHSHIPEVWSCSKINNSENMFTHYKFLTSNIFKHSYNRYLFLKIASYARSPYSYLNFSASVLVNEKAQFSGKDNNAGKNRRQQEKRKNKQEMD